MVKAFLIGSILFVLAASGIWYFFGRKYDYTISFKTANPVNTASYALQAYNYEEFVVKNREVISLRELEQQGNFKGSALSLKWELAALNDSVTRITAGIKNLESPLLNRLNLLFKEDVVQKELKEEISLLRDNLEDLGNSFRVKIDGEKVFPAATCACLTLENTVDRKAMEMARSINYLSDFVVIHELEPEGRPRVHVKEWDVTGRHIKFDFCFPLKEGSVVPEDKLIFKKEIPAAPALKAVFNGNYTNSHHAWLRLLSYAEKNGIELEEKPLEIFHDNPQMGGDPLLWEATIYLPIKSLSAAQ